MERTYSVSIARASKELTKKEAVMYKDTTEAIRLDGATEDGSVIVDVAGWVELDVHNEKAKDGKDYKNFVILATDGTKYLTGSQSFWNSFLDIYEEMDGEDITIKIYRKPSKNYSGKSYLTCSLM